MQKKIVVLVSGLSGAGKTTALRHLEDMGYEVVDNMPLRMLPALLKDPEIMPHKLALGVDVRNHDITSHYNHALDLLKHNEEIDSHLIFLEADTDVLIRRFSETRRRHPLTVNRPLEESIALEQQLLAPMRAEADVLIDTSAMSPKQLNKLLYARFAFDNNQKLQVFVMSFGFKHGLPREADVVLDVRFLQNPYWQQELRAETGQNPAVRAYVQADGEYATAVGNMLQLLHHQLHQFEKADRAYVTVAIGCTGGHHRSVVVAEDVAARLAEKGVNVRCHHRDLV